MAKAELTAQASRMARGAGRAVNGGAGWLADRLEDAARWIVNLIRYLPNRVGQLGMTLVLATAGMVMLLPVGVRVWRRGGRTNFGAWLRARVRQGAIRVVQLVLEALDLVGLPEIFGFLWRLITRVSPLTGTEIAAASEVLGSSALRYHDVRVAQGGILSLVFKRNGERAFSTFHTVNLPRQGGHGREHLDIVLHELVHVLQYERAGSRYFAEALVAQYEEGYGYGGSAGLLEAHGHGKRLRNFNREQQAQIVQDYYLHLRDGWDTGAFEPFIAELRAGRL